jgi:hypothetical protein
MGEPFTLQHEGSFKNYGSLALDAEGNFTYQKGGQNTEFSGTFTVDYTIMDWDGDTDTATLSIEVKDNIVKILPPDGRNYDLKVNEKYLSAEQNDGKAGTAATDDPVLSVKKTLDFTTPDGFASITIGDITIAVKEENGQKLYSINGSDFLALIDNKVETVVEGKYGNLSVALLLDVDNKGGSLEYQYELTGRAEHVEGQGKNPTLANPELNEVFNVTVKDLDGDYYSAPISVKIIDDVPKITINGGDDALRHVIHGTEDLNFGELVKNYGADGKAAIDYFVVSLAGGEVIDREYDGDVWVYKTELGELRVDPNNNYEVTYVPNENTGSTETFTLTVKDGDGDTASVTLTAKVEKNLPVTFTLVTTVKVFEKYLPEGTATDLGKLSQAGEFKIGEGNGLTELTFGGQNLLDAVGEIKASFDPIEGKYGTVVITSVTLVDGEYIVQYTYTLDSNALHNAPPAGVARDPNTDIRENEGKGPESFIVTAKDVTGEELANAAVTVTIVDDMPVLGTEDERKPVANDDGTAWHGKLADIGADYDGAKVEFHIENMENAWFVEGRPVILEYGPDNSSVIGRVNGNEVLRIEADRDADGHFTGTFTFTQGPDVLFSGGRTTHQHGDKVTGGWDSDGGSAMYLLEIANGIKSSVPNNDSWVLRFTGGTGDNNTPRYDVNPNSNIIRTGSSPGQGAQVGDWFRIEVDHPGQPVNSGETDIITFMVLGGAGGSNGRGAYSFSVTMTYMGQDGIVREGVAIGTFGGPARTQFRIDMPEDGAYIMDVKLTSQLAGSGLMIHETGGFATHRDTPPDPLDIGFTVTDADGDKVRPWMNYRANEDMSNGRNIRVCPRIQHGSAFKPPADCRYRALRHQRCGNGGRGADHAA